MGYRSIWQRSIGIRFSDNITRRTNLKKSQMSNINTYQGTNINKGKLIAERVRIGEILKQNRESKRLSLAELSERTGYTENALGGAEAGAYSPSLDLLTTLGIYLDFEVELMKW